MCGLPGKLEEYIVEVHSIASNWGDLAFSQFVTSPVTFPNFRKVDARKLISSLIDPSTKPMEEPLVGCLAKYVVMGVDGQDK
jgi:hypothetical protein